MLDFRLSQTIRVTCQPGLPEYLEQELRDLGVEPTNVRPTSVEFKATINDAMRLVLHLRTALHVMVHLAGFRSPDPQTLYDRVRVMRWEELIPIDGYFSVHSTCRTDAVDNSMFASLKVKDAIVDRMNEKCGRRPDTGSDRNRLVLHLYWRDEQARLMLNLTGEKLSDRGYRKIPFKAPMQETLAAAVVTETDYDGTQPFVNPMCGSGTLAIEAALIALRRPPGLLRGNYSMMHMKDFDADAWKTLRIEARKQGQKHKPQAPIIASDIDAEAIDAARKNATTAGVDHLIEFHCCDFADTPVPTPAAFDDDEKPSGVVLFNPAYGMRLGEEQQLERTYKRIGDFLKNDCAGYAGFVFTANSELAKAVHLRPEQRVPFMSADLDCRLLRYELYAGSRVT